MARLGLKTVNTPDYASSQPMPYANPEERPVQKIEKFATFLNELPWFSKGEDKPEGGAGLATVEGVPMSQDELDKDVQSIMVEDRDPDEVAIERAAAINPRGTMIQPGYDMTDASLPSFELSALLEGYPGDTFAPYQPTEEQITENTPRKDLWEKAEKGKKAQEMEDDYNLDWRKMDKAHIKEWQKMFGLTGKDVDGIWGPGTEAAYQKFLQQKWGKKDG